MIQSSCCIPSRKSIVFSSTHPIYLTKTTTNRRRSSTPTRINGSGRKSTEWRPVEKIPFVKFLNFIELTENSSPTDKINIRELIGKPKKVPHRNLMQVFNQSFGSSKTESCNGSLDESITEDDSPPLSNLSDMLSNSSASNSYTCSFTTGLVSKSFLSERPIPNTFDKLTVRLYAKLETFDATFKCFQGGREQNILQKSLTDSVSEGIERISPLLRKYSKYSMRINFSSNLGGIPCPVQNKVRALRILQGLRGIILDVESMFSDDDVILDSIQRNISAVRTAIESMNFFLTETERDYRLLNTKLLAT